MNTVLWNLSIMDTIGTQLAVQCGEVSLIQRQICTQLYVVMTADSVLVGVLSFIQSVLIERSHCVQHDSAHSTTCWPMGM